VTTLERKCGALVKNVGRWSTSSAPYASLVGDLQTHALQLKAAAELVARHIGDLVETGAPIVTTSGGGRMPMAVGDSVILRENRYNSEIHGANDFEIVSQHDRFFKIQSRATDETHYVPRQWIKRQDDGTKADRGDVGDLD
jgi:hypothetical protein